MIERASSTSPTILVVDDEPTLREAIAYNLRRAGFTVAQSGDGQEAVAIARAARPALVVLDVMLPGIDGFAVCRILRAESAVPILFLSAKGELEDRIAGLELGGDDYLTKPFAMRELMARVRAMLRRMTDDGEASNPPPSPPVPQDRRPAETWDAPVVRGDLTVDPARRQVLFHGLPLELRPKEFELLHYLARHAGLAISRPALLREVWGYDFPIDTRTVDVHIRWLREKLETDPARPRRIQTVRGYGYRFVPEPV